MFRIQMKDGETVLTETENRIEALGIARILCLMDIACIVVDEEGEIQRAWGDDDSEAWNAAENELREMEERTGQFKVLSRY